MTTKDEVRSTERALKLALEALERCGSESYTLEREAITAIREALAEQPAQQEPREHETSEHCWCHPTLDYKDPDTGNEVWVHNEPH